ncbi:hypothetical protein ACLMJK_005319 [Lecanora helva]
MKYPKRNWRDAFEDLIALETRGEMISTESRDEEKATARRIGLEIASKRIGKLMQWNDNDAKFIPMVEASRRMAERSERNKHLIPWFDDQFKGLQGIIGFRFSLAQMFKDRQEDRQDWPASKRKGRGQWLQSLITHGAMTDWSSWMQDSSDGEHFGLIRETSEDNDSVTLTELELGQLFEDGKPFEHGNPGPPLYQVPDDTSAADREPEIRHLSVPPPDRPPPLYSYTPERSYFVTQELWAKPVGLPSKRVGTEVTLKNFFTNGETEETVFVQEPGKVLEEVEKARASIEDRMLGLDQPCEPLKVPTLDELLNGNIDNFDQDDEN